MNKNTNGVFNIVETNKKHVWCISYSPKKKVILVTVPQSEADARISVDRKKDITPSGRDNNNTLPIAAHCSCSELPPDGLNGRMRPPR